MGEDLREQVIKYYKTHLDCYPSEVAGALDTDLKKVVKIVKQLLKEEILVVAS